MTNDAYQELLNKMLEAVCQLALQEDKASSISVLEGKLLNRISFVLYDTQRKTQSGQKP